MASSPPPHSFWVCLLVLRAENERSSKRQNQFISGEQGRIRQGKKIGGSWETKAQTEFFGNLGVVLRDGGDVRSLATLWCGGHWRVRRWRCLGCFYLASVIHFPLWTLLRGCREDLFIYFSIWIDNSYCHFFLGNCDCEMDHKAMQLF